MTGTVAPGFKVQFCFNIPTREMTCEILGGPRAGDLAKELTRYRILRREFLERVVAMTGEAIGVLEYDEQGRATDMHTVEPPAAGHA